MSRIAFSSATLVDRTYQFVVHQSITLLKTDLFSSNSASVVSGSSRLLASLENTFLIYSRDSEAASEVESPLTFY